MKTEDILLLDLREKENEEIIRRVLCKIKPLKRYEDKEGPVPLESIEKVISAMVKKYNITVQYIMPSYVHKFNFYSVSLMGAKEFNHLGSVFGHTLYEAYAKTLIKMYSLVKQGVVEERECES